MILLVLSSCSWFSDRFGKDDEQCPVGACDESGELSANESWYCYGVQEDRSWDCSHDFQPEKITSIDPSAARPARKPSPEPVVETPLVAKEISTEAVLVEESAIVERKPVEELSSVASPIPTEEEQAGELITAAGSEQGGNYILGQPADAYTVQLIAMQEENNMLSYATHNGIGAPLYARIQSKESDWYVLLLGTYDDRQSAEEAKDSWEGTRTLKIKPWVRKLGPLQDAIRLARN